MLTVFPAAVCQLCTLHSGGIQHLDEPQGAIHAAHQQQVLGLTAPQRDCLPLRPGQCRHPVGLDVQDALTT